MKLPTTNLIGSKDVWRRAIKTAIRTAKINFLIAAARLLVFRCFEVAHDLVVLLDDCSNLLPEALVFDWIKVQRETSTQCHLLNS